MTLSPDEAARSLNEIERARSLSRKFLSYERSSVFFFLWGTLWLIANTLIDFYPTRSGLIWFVADAVGIPASIYLGVRMRSQVGSVWAWRYSATIAVYVAFATSALWLMHPISGRQIYTFYALLIAAIYMGVGIWFGARYLVAGLALAALSVGGYLFLPTHFWLWTGIVGGGTLLLTGLWMRKA